MRHEDLEQALNEARVDPRVYSLNHQSDEGEQYCIKRVSLRPERWEVYYSERGQQNSLQTFYDEEVAVAAFYEVVMADPTTRHPPSPAT
jgi:nicotinamide mononucleotide adenylyltransferase